MLEFGITTGGAGGTNFWQLIGGGDDDIELNPAIATGIAAPLPSEPRLTLYLNVDSVAGPRAMFEFKDTGINQTSDVGVIFDSASGLFLPVVSTINLATGDEFGSSATKAKAYLGWRNGVNTNELVVNTKEASFVVNNVVKFGVDQAGKIRTNQVVSPAGLVPNGGFIPIYDIAGGLLGYMPLYS